MPERIETAQITGVQTDLEINDEYPETYGFRVQLSRDPGSEWGVEFDSVYETTRYPGKPPIVFDGDGLRVYYLPRYADDLPNFFRLLQKVVAQTNQAVEQRNRVLPDEEDEKRTFQRKLQEAARQLTGSS